MDLAKLEKDLENLSDLRNHPGFDVLMSVFLERKEVIEDIRTCQDDKVLWFRQGQLDIIDFVDNIESFVSSSLESLKGANDEDYS